MRAWIELLYDVLDEDHRGGAESGGYYSIWVVAHITDEGAIDTGPGPDLDHTWLVGQRIEHNVPHGEHQHAATAREFLQDSFSDFVERWGSVQEDGTITHGNAEEVEAWAKAGFDWDAEVLRQATEA